METTAAGAQRRHPWILCQPRSLFCHHRSSQSAAGSPFRGGMSVPSGLPTWGEFLVKMGDHAECDESELSELVNCSNFEEAADLLLTSMDPLLFAERVEGILHINDTDPVRGAVGLLPSLFPRLVITTNLDNVLERLYEVSEVSFVQLSELVNCSNFEEAADLLLTSMDPLLFAERVEGILHINDTDPVRGAVGLLPSLFPRLVITTNLDNVLERLYEVSEVSFVHTLSGKEIANYRQLNNPQESFLIKLHGDHRNQEGRVLLPKEYDEAYSEGSPIGDEVTLLCRTNSLLFLGCSLGSDRTVRLIHQMAQADQRMPRHYALLAKPDHDSERVARENFLAARRIFPIWYDLPHDESIMALLDGLEVNRTPL